VTDRTPRGCFWDERTDPGKKEKRGRCLTGVRLCQTRFAPGKSSTVHFCEFCTVTTVVQNKGGKKSTSSFWKRGQSPFPRHGFDRVCAAACVERSRRLVVKNDRVVDLRKVPRLEKYSREALSDDTVDLEVATHTLQAGETLCTCGAWEGTVKCQEAVTKDTRFFQLVKAYLNLQHRAADSRPLKGKVGESYQRTTVVARTAKKEGSLFSTLSPTVYPDTTVRPKNWIKVSCLGLTSHPAPVLFRT